MNEEIYIKAIEIMEGAAATALVHFRQDINIDLKSDESAVTAVDLQIEKGAVSDQVESSTIYLYQ